LSNDLIDRARIVANEQPNEEIALFLELAAAILEELQKNAENRKKALETWVPK